MKAPSGGCVNARAKGKLLGGCFTGLEEVPAEEEAAKLAGRGAHLGSSVCGQAPKPLENGDLISSLVPPGEDSDGNVPSP